MRLSAISFACYSAACAPPPTGTGGSGGFKQMGNGPISHPELIRKRQPKKKVDALAKLLRAVSVASAKKIS